MTCPSVFVGPTVAQPIPICARLPIRARGKDVQPRLRDGAQSPRRGIITFAPVTVNDRNGPLPRGVTPRFLLPLSCEMAACKIARDSRLTNKASVNPGRNFFLSAQRAKGDGLPFAGQRLHAGSPFGERATKERSGFRRAVLLATIPGHGVHFASPKTAALLHTARFGRV